MILAFDFGMSKIGVAAGQTITNTASKIAIINALNGAPQNWSCIEEFMIQYKPKLLIIGLPLNMDGSDSDLSNKARRFANRLNGRFQIPIFLQDERLTSFEARQYSKEKKIDDLAAVIILQNYLENSNGKDKNEKSNKH